MVCAAFRILAGKRQQQGSRSETMSISRHRFHGAVDRFEAVAGFIYDRYGNDIRYIADVAGGRGMLSRILEKKYNYECEVVDPRGWVLKGVKSREEAYTASLASYYHLIVGLHCDEALREVAASAMVRPVVLVPCCNFWSGEKLGQLALLEAIECYYRSRGIGCERVVLSFKGPKNIGLVSQPPTVSR
jgi:hypothetical protein